MAGITSVPSTRVSDAFVRQRLLAQIQFDQSALFRIQNSISTGRRITLPSEDAPAALRAISIQSLLERKTQAKTNLTTNESYLGATDTAISDVSGLLNSIRGAAISVVDSTIGTAQRHAVAEETKRTLQQLIDIGNHLFRGRYLFAGADTQVRPYDEVDGVVRYNGNEASLLSFSDIDLLFETNMSGDAVFGGISEPIRGTTDVNPVLKESTRLSDLRGGLGITKGSVQISDGTNTRIVDISAAVTIGDVKRILETNPPAGRILTARVTETGLSIALDAVGGGNLTIHEVGAGTTGKELGILNSLGIGTGPLAGADLNPRLLKTTPLGDILGVRASAVVQPTGAGNDLLFEAAVQGPEFNGVTIKFIDDARLQAGPGLLVGSEAVNFHETPVAARAALVLPGLSNDLLLTASAPGTVFNDVKIDIVNDGNIGDAANVSYNAGTRTLRIGIDDTNETTIDTLIAQIAADGTFTAARDATAEMNLAGGVVPTSVAGANVANTYNSGSDANTLAIHIHAGQTTAQHVISAVNAQGTFTARLDKSEPGNSGTGFIPDSYTDPTAMAVTAGGSGEPLDQLSGLQIVNGGKTHVIDLSVANTVEDLLNILNGSDAGVSAAINAAGNGIDVRSRLSSANFSIGENGGTTATQLGLRSFTAATPLDGLNYGQGVRTVSGPDFTIERSDGVTFAIDVDGAQTIQDILDRINNNAVNTGSGTPVLARLAQFGNGVELVTDGPAGAGALAVRPIDFSSAAEDLGFVPVGAAESEPPIPGEIASAAVTMAGANNDIVIRAKHPGDHANDVAVSFVDTGLGAGNETVTYNPVTRVLVFDVDAATTTAADLQTLIQANPLTDFYFEVELTAADGAPNDGSGLVDLTAAATIQGGVAESLQGRDTNPSEVQSVFTALKRLERALLDNSTLGIERAIELVDVSATQLNFSRAELGARMQGLDVLRDRIESEEIDLKATLSLEIETDLPSAIIELTARQASFEASLRAAAQSAQLTLLDFL